VARLELDINLFVTDGLINPEVNDVDEVDGAMFVNDGKTVIYVENAGVDAADIPFVTGLLIDGVYAVSDMTETIANGEIIWFGPFNMNTFNQPSGDDIGKIYINVTDSMNIVAFRINV